MLKLRRGKYSLVGGKNLSRRKAIGVAIKDLSLPKNCTISGILRGNEMILPRGVDNTRMQATKFWR